MTPVAPLLSPALSYDAVGGPFMGNESERISFNIQSRIQVNSPALNSSAHLEKVSMSESCSLWHKKERISLPYRLTM